MATIKEIFAQVSMMNPTVSTVSSIGSFVDNNNAEVANFVTKNIVKALPKDSLAYKIITSTTGRFSEKQMWVVAYELKKNAKYCADLDKRLAEISARENAKKSARKARKQQKAECKQNNANLKVGDNVKHAQFGEGVVTELTDTVITVNFKNVEKKLMRNFAKLEKF